MAKYLDGIQIIESGTYDANAVTPSDTTTMTPTKGIYVGVSGDVKVAIGNGKIITFKGLASGVIHPITCYRVYATGTTATNIVAVY